MNPTGMAMGPREVRAYPPDEDGRPYPGAQRVERERIIPGCMCRLREAVGIHGKMLEELVQRLGPITLDEPRQDGRDSKPEPPSPAMCHHAGEIDSIASQVHGLNQILQSLLGRVQI